MSEQNIDDAAGAATTPANGVAPSVDMSVDLGPIHLKNPINTAAGTYGFGWQFEGFYDVSQLGAITTKGCAAEPWQGNPAPRMTEICSGVMNSVGLQNPGVRGLVASSGEYLQQLSDKGTAVICQVAGHSVDEYVAAVELFEERPSPPASRSTSAAPTSPRAAVPWDRRPRARPRSSARCEAAPSGRCS